MDRLEDILQTFFGENSENIKEIMDTGWKDYLNPFSRGFIEGIYVAHNLPKYLSQKPHINYFQSRKEKSMRTGVEIGGLVTTFGYLTLVPIFNSVLPLAPIIFANLFFGIRKYYN